MHNTITPEIAKGMKAEIKESVPGFIRTLWTNTLDIFDSKRTLAQSLNTIQNVHDRISAITNITIQNSDGKELILNSRHFVITDVSGNINSMQLTLKIKDAIYDNVTLKGDLNSISLNRVYLIRF
ncbi:MAG: hypothetical protein LBS81_00290 [Endomicrobium sp.]|nr:hypothetical protein [Endomicrobium sp.]